ncbi:MAG: alternative ribosome rescue aminoacyl-tRNA hydrolase ArfB [Myxococcota bacterium]|nr:alternative ribosome rescue aminoacyl-tRNA hydrolase ArfB [Myxococcota bacterium]
MSDLVVQPGLVIPAAELRESASRSGGPGGQHVNKTSTRVTLRWNLRESTCVTPAQRSRLRRRLGTRVTQSGDVVVHARRHRSQARNRALARERLAELLRDALTPRRPRVPTRPSRASIERRLEAKRRRSAQKRLRRPDE